MLDNKKIQVTKSKKKLVKLLLGCLLFTIMGLWMFIYPNDFISSIFRSLSLIKTTGIICAIFALVSLIIIIQLFFDKEFALEISDEGILDNTNIFRLKKVIKWSDIRKIEKQKVMSSNFLKIYIKDNKNYFEDIRNPLIKTILKLKNKNSPITSISSASLNMNFKELEKIIMERFQHFR